jgi:DNA-binding transcriptional MocR family regulator
MAIAEFLQNGGYDRHLRRMKKGFADQIRLVTAAISQYFPKGTKVARPTGGFLLWVALPQRVDSLRLHAMALQEKISIAPGPMFSAKQQYKNFIRLNCGQVTEGKIEGAIATLGRLAGKLIQEAS